MKIFTIIKTLIHKALLTIKGFFVTQIKIEEKLKTLIDKKAHEMNSNSLYHLEEISKYIKQLNLYIDGILQLSSSELESKLEYLVGFFTITLEHPIDAGLKFLRAVKYQEEIDTTFPCYEEVSRLSYIPKDSSITPNIGRLNKQGDSIYYGCIFFNDKFGGYNVAFSEVNALEYDRINILKSTTTQGLMLNLIGFMDYIFRESKPYFISDDTYEYYKKMYEYMEAKFDPNLFVAFQLCDAFFADILNSKESGKLYDITSVLASIFLDGERSDGLLYASVQAKGSPVVALKTSAIDNKVKHQSAECFEIIKYYGYAKYHAKQICTGTIEKNNISWKRVNN